MKRPTYKILEQGFPVTGKTCRIKEHAGEYGLFCEDLLIGTGDADRLSDWALFTGGCKEVYHDYDLRQYGNEPGARYYDELHLGEGGGVNEPGEGGL